MNKVMPVTRARDHGVRPERVASEQEAPGHRSSKRHAKSVKGKDD